MTVNPFYLSVNVLIIYTNYTCKVLLIRCKSVERCYVNLIDIDIDTLLDIKSHVCGHIMNNNFKNENTQWNLQV